MKKIKILFFIATSLLLCSCQKYLDVVPKDKFIAQKIEDYDLMLNSDDVVNSSDLSVLISAGDDFETADIINQLAGFVSTPFYNSFIYQEQIYNSGKNILWNAPYKGIYYYNIIISEIDGAEGTNESLRKSVKAEALLGRAFNYFMLVNLFGKQYKAETANTDLGVPIITLASIDQEKQERSTVQEVYNFILNDVTKALPNLRASNVKYRASKASAYGLLARLYLYQGNYAQALANANAALALNNYIDNYTSKSILPIAGYNQEALAPFFNQEQLYMRQSNSTSVAILQSLYLSQEFQSSFHPNDVRPLIYTTDYFNLYGSAAGYPEGLFLDIVAIRENHGFSTAEIYLTRAECTARTGNLQPALDDLNTVKRNRIIGFTDLTLSNLNNNAEDVLKEILDERRREMFLSGTRLFDLKRLNLDPRFAKTITHTAQGADYILKPNGNNYVFQIPSEQLSINPKLIKNPRD
ncbi:RagB/SusD family nutrient uptake outer membrane protein [Pedobacter sp. MW01-1-1]|uniref:RagB/SusD family nutrient uptake outer membrane protein n=1 Tax=Pedobacter sp. MW01-1-1 TaxID=3383027 RepID=UPI003FF0C36C